MRINGIGNGTYSDAMPAGRRAEPDESQTVKLLDELGISSELGTSRNQALTEILAQYDVTDITPRDFSELLQKLHKTGALPDDVLKELALVRADLDRKGVAPDEQIDLIEFYSEQLEERETWGFVGEKEGEPSTSDLSFRLGWLQKFGLMHAAPDSLGLDETA
ncbi:MAG: hypothetical protein JW818_18910 [Pirellulales bacterium]|nr:hypothetical protein [Pirellulales bacterium]